MNDKAYTPQFISIGPFHHHTRNDLIANEHYKLQGFNNFLHRIKINYKQIESSKKLVEKCHGKMKEAWNCYAIPIKMEDQLDKMDKFFQLQDNVEFSFFRRDIL